MWARITAFFQSKAGRVVRAGVSAVLLGWLVSQVEWGVLAREKIAWMWVAAALVLTAGSYTVCAWRWWLLLRAQELAVTFAWAHRWVWVGQFYNAFLPGGVGGDAVRVAAGWAQAPERKAAVTAATLVDRVAGFGVLLAMIPMAWLLFAPEASLGWGAGMPAWGWVGILAVASCVVCIFVTQSKIRWPQAWREAAVRAWGKPGVLLGAAGLSVLVWVMDFAAGWWLARAVGVDVGPGVMSVALGLAYLSTMLPISIGGHGLREGALVLALRTMGVEGRLTELAILFFAVSVACSLAGGLLSLARGASRKEAKDA